MALWVLLSLFAGLFFLFSGEQYCPGLLLEHSLAASCSTVFFSPVITVGSAGGCRRRSLCLECTEEFLNAHPGNGRCLPNSPHQGPGEAPHDSRYTLPFVLRWIHVEGGTRDKAFPVYGLVIILNSIYKVLSWSVSISLNHYMTFLLMSSTIWAPWCGHCDLGSTTLNFSCLKH